MKASDLGYRSGTSCLSAFKHWMLAGADRLPYLQAWYAAHPPRRGLICLGTRPLVHKGFLTAWSEVADRVSAAVQEVLQGLTDGQREAFQIFVTGCSPPPPASCQSLPTTPDNLIRILPCRQCFEAQNSTLNHKTLRNQHCLFN